MAQKWFGNVVSALLYLSLCMCVIQRDMICIVLCFSLLKKPTHQHKYIYLPNTHIAGDTTNIKRIIILLK